MVAALVLLSSLSMAASLWNSSDVDAFESSDNCDVAAYTYCCGVGKACWCNQDPPSGMSQCGTVAKGYCCHVGTPCDCSAPPSSSGLSCTIMGKACDKIFGDKSVASEADCTAETLEVAAVCEAVGFGPEDPLADICAAVLGTAVEAACVKAVKAGLTFGKDQCRKAAGCDGSGSTTPTPKPWAADVIRPIVDGSVCLDLPGGDTSNGNRVWLWSCTGGENQRWNWTNGAIHPGSDASKCLDIPGSDFTSGNLLQVWDCTGVDGQEFGYNIEQQTVYLGKTALTDKPACVDVPGGSAYDGAPVWIWSCEEGSQNQKWLLGGEESKLFV